MATFTKTESKQVDTVLTSKGKGPQWYKGYDIKWLKGLEDEHPDFPFVAEYEKKFGEIK